MKTFERLTHRASLGSAIVIYTGQCVGAGQVRLHAVIGGDGSHARQRGPLAAWEQPQAFAAEVPAAFKSLR
jgi:hypothetical protein